MRVNVLRLEPAILKNFNNPTTGYMQPGLLQPLSITGAGMAHYHLHSAGVMTDQGSSSSTKQN
jgi:hypothetical protein